MPLNNKNSPGFIPPSGNRINLLVLFDGKCILCSMAVRFIIRFDKKKLFHFTAIQSQAGKKFFTDHKDIDEFPGTIVLIENGKSYFRSTAVLRILKKLSGGWPLFYALIIIPVPIRDFFYKFVAGKRYKWFGKFQECMIPDENFRRRFIN